MKKIVMFEHGGSGNHGCEAIVRSTVSMLGQNKYYLESNCPNEDIRYGISDMVNLIPSNNDEQINPNSLLGIYWRMISKFDNSLDFDDRERLHRHRRLLFNDSIALSIGGDNYCYGAIIGSIRDKLKAFKHNGTKTVLWGCSIGTEKIDSSAIEDLKSYDLITARESLTAELLYRYGIDKKVTLCVDPAFTLKAQEIRWNSYMLEQNEVIGINVSDFMRLYNSYPDATYKNFYKLIEYIIHNTNYNIVMIPHVVQKGNDDRIPIKKLASELNSERIYFINEDFNCMQLKYIISKCKMFIGCRTHSTIAAYSTCVPTLVVGYSTKARGICRDIFGSEEDLLIDARNFETDYDLTNKFMAFSERRDELKTHLERVMPGYIKKAYAPRESVLKLL